MNKMIQKVLYLILLYIVSTREVFCFDDSEKTSRIDFPSTNRNLLRQKNQTKEQKNLKKIEDVVLQAVRKQKKKRLRKKSKKRMSCSCKKDSKVSLEKEIAVEIQRLMDKQYNDTELIDKRLSISLKKVTIHKAIELIGKASGVKFVIDSDVEGLVKNFTFKDAPLSALLTIILNNNTPRLALIKQFGVWRIVKFISAIEILKNKEVELREQDTNLGSFTLFHARWDDNFKNRVEKLWQGIVGPNANKLGHYLVFDDSSRKLFFKARSHQQNDFKRCLQEFDIEIPQIRIEARVILASKDFEEGLGFNWSGIYNRSNSITQRGYGFAGIGVGQSQGENGVGNDLFKKLLGWSLNFIPSKASNAFNINLPFVWGNKDFSTRRLNLLLNAAESKNEIKIVSKPTLLVNNDEVAEILVGQEFPQEVRLNETVEGQPTNITTVRYKDVGMKIKVKPVVTPDRHAVFLDIFVESSSVAYADIQRDNKLLDYIIKISRSKNRVLLKSGQTTLISGLVTDNKEINRNGIPFLQEIPVLGLLFKGRHKRIKGDQLLIFITPTLI
jgi:type IV pilus assembly protein PilQ